MNKAILVGRLGKAPEVTEASGMTIAKFSIATDEYSKTKGKYTEWHNCVAFGNIADNVQRFLDKGSLVSIEGKISTDSYENDGEKKYFTSIICHRVNFLSGGRDQQQRDSLSLPDTDLPF